jgi:glucokinase
MILAGDVGGTKTALALFDDERGALHLAREDVLPSREFPSVEAVVRRFLGNSFGGHIRAACFGVAGPVVDGRVTTTNLPWHLEERALEVALGADHVKLVNDLEAAAHGMLSLSPADFATLQRGDARPAHRVLISAGTGLGEAILVGDGQRHIVVASEGGHADFAPRDEREIRLLRFLSRDVDHVSYERVLSGPGLYHTYRFLREDGGVPEPSWLTEKLANGDPAAVVSEAGLSGHDSVCAEALELFCSILGAEAGNLALKALALGGVYVAGGIAPRIRPTLEDGRFVGAFRAKGRLAPLMATIPIWLALDLRAPLLGAASLAKGLAAVSG